ncbi:MAG: protein-export membrane protein SecF [Gammaproteobacteria bacterium]|nr:MAG: protein translocase subunit SecF [Pseudomonadota bacterium]MBC6944318.1 protein translocase subunit SecF [Gammaproteobacteria bacterium]MDL1879425.1 protein translocase subunit SecF [Gammaproteobacteria bacterium PRO2]MCL4777651.1 protein translocase subunit SecF [Gammaproteobacteria bacterium]MCQ3934441.1 protein translocase subunit SecF [Gammaproteobacteria bacterium]
MEFFKKKTNIDFMGKSTITTILSLVMFAVSIGSFMVRGLNLGIDFTGGVLVEVGFSEAADLAQVRHQLEASGFGEAQVQNIGSAREVLIRLPPREQADSGKLGQEIIGALQKANPGVVLRRIEFVGPQVGKDLTQNGILALVVCLLLIGVYIMFRFQWKFAVGAIVGVIHDPIITLGIFSEFGIPFDLSVIAAVLAITGYSLNDTVVIFDRMRENFRRARGVGSVPEIMNRSINDTLSRTLMTHFTTSLVIVALLVFGGEALRSFSIALAIGLVICTYSSIYCAGSTAMYLKITPADFAPVKKEKGEVDALP